VDIDFSVEAERVAIRATVSTSSKTGVEMEALMAVSVAALTLYDMCKAIDKTMVLSGIRVVSKTKQ
jgi:cyclic pyranopterin phosphate synthase